VKKLLCLIPVLLVGCGGPVYIPPSDVIDEPISSGRYDVVMTRTAGDCNHFPEREEGVWAFRDNYDGGLYVYVSGVRMESENCSYFYGQFETGKEPCDILIEVHSDVYKTDDGFDGTVMLDVEIGILLG